MYQALKKEAPKQQAIQKKDAKKPNYTGIPDTLKTKYENHSGFSFDDVRVHYNSDKPAQFQAFAYTQGNQVYMAPRQERHLEHELGHVVQQKQGIVKPTGRINNIAVNEDKGLEKKADLLGGCNGNSALEQHGGNQTIQRKEIIQFTKERIPFFSELENSINVLQRRFILCCEQFQEYIIDKDEDVMSYKCKKEIGTLRNECYTHIKSIPYKLLKDDREIVLSELQITVTKMTLKLNDCYEKWKRKNVHLETEEEFVPLPEGVSLFNIYHAFIPNQYETSGDLYDFFVENKIMEATEAVALDHQGGHVADKKKLYAKVLTKEKKVRTYIIGECQHSSGKKYKISNCAIKKWEGKDVNIY